jgi:phage tail sheath protein FI
MSLYGTPGIYLRPVAPVPVAGLATGVPAFLGYAARPGSAGQMAAVNEPVALRHWTEFVAAFGGAAAGGYLAAAVSGFFANGGELCYVVALADDPVDPDQALDDGLAAVAPVEDVDLVAAPDLSRPRPPLRQPPPIDALVRMQQRIIDECDRKGDRLALLDAPADADVDGMLRYRGRLTGTNAALYYPWLVVGDPSSGGTRAVPPCGHVAGVYASTDQSVGVFKAPANAVLEGVLDLSRLISSADQDRLNPVGVNALRAFPGRGIRVWGARTLSTDANWRYVSVRRLFMTAGRWIERNLAAVAFEPHDTRLWARIGRELTVYFDGLFRAGALKGATAVEAYFVKCDADTNPPAGREAGMVVTDIALAAAIPNEFIVVRISVAPSGVTLAALG